jgi:anti-sigma-K factor RskA
MIPADPTERSALAGEYVLGLLAPAEAAAVEAALPLDAGLDQDVRYWEERLSPICDIVSPTEPDPGLWARIERDLGLAGPPAASAPGLLGRAWESLGLWRMAAAVAGLAALVVAGLFAPATQRPAAPAYVAVLQAKDQSAGWLVEVGADRQVRMTALGASDPGPGRALQLWTLIDPAKGPISLGMLPSRNALRFPARPAPAIGEGQLFEISVEPEAGSPIGRPTGPVLFIGRTVAVGAAPR